MTCHTGKLRVVKGGDIKDVFVGREIDRVINWMTVILYFWKELEPNGKSVVKVGFSKVMIGSLWRCTRFGG